MKYNWQQPDWPDFKYDLHDVADILLTFATETGLITGMLHTMPGDMQMEAIIDTMVAEAIKTSEIEGELVSRQDVMSSIRHYLGLDATTGIRDKKARGVGQLMVDVRNTYAAPLTVAQLLHWHSMLMDGDTHISIGQWRTRPEPMQVVSGGIGREKVHFEAPPSAQVPKEMDDFIQWFNDTAPDGNRAIKKAPLRSAIAHLYFESIHPFEDGNGRIGRAIAEKALSQTLGRPVLLSLSRAIESDKKSYYTALENAQRSNEITAWVSYFVTTVLQAQIQTKQLVAFILKKARFFDLYKGHLNERQLKAARRMMEEGPEGFEGGMNAKKYMAIAKTSKATATRDLQHLTEIGAFTVQGAGRSTRYTLHLDEQA